MSWCAASSKQTHTHTHTHSWERGTSDSFQGIVYKTILITHIECLHTASASSSSWQLSLRNLCCLDELNWSEFMRNVKFLTPDHSFGMFTRHTRTHHKFALTHTIIHNDFRLFFFFSSCVVDSSWGAKPLAEWKKRNEKIVGEKTGINLNSNKIYYLCMNGPMFHRSSGDLPLFRT